MNDNDINIFEKGIENHESFQYNFLPNQDRKKVKSKIMILKIKLMMQMLSLLILGPFLTRKSSQKNKVKFIYGSTHKKILEKHKEYECISLGRCLSNIKELTSSENIVRRISLKEILKEVMFNLGKVKLSNISYYLEFSIINCFIRNNKKNITEILVAGHQDRITTWLSLLSKKNNIPFMISQHGILTDLKVPNKIYASRVACYNSYEQVFFERCLINNKDCIYKLKGLETSFEVFNHNFSEPTIGFFSQYGETENTLKISKLIANEVKDMKLIVFPHPGEPKQKYNKLKKEKNIEISYKKYVNLDTLLTYRSTIIYDYLANKEFKGKIVYFPGNFKHEMSFSNIKGLVKVNNEKELLANLK